MGTAHWRAARVSIKSTVVGSRRQSAASPNMKAQFADLGSTAIALSPADFGKLIAGREVVQGNPPPTSNRNRRGIPVALFQQRSARRRQPTERRQNRAFPSSAGSRVNHIGSNLEGRLTFASPRAVITSLKVLPTSAP
jgi:hypothetical protein